MKRIDDPEILPDARAAQTHVVILDGTLSSLREGCETNAGLLYKLLQESGANRSVYYEPGIQWNGWRTTRSVLTGLGINRMIRRAYGALASRYRPGDRIFLFGYSRGAYAVRSLAGVIDRVGLLRPEAATPRHLRDIYRHYQMAPDSESAQAFARAHCYDSTEIEMVGVWDTVKALGIRAPIIWRFSEPAHAFHSHALGNSIRHGFHALALDETRNAYAPVLWRCRSDFPGVIEQVWFRGAHGDIGGQLSRLESARGLSNIPLVWMLERAERCGLSFPADWRLRFPVNPDAPSVGSWRGWGKFFWSRSRRTIGLDASESLHASVDRPHLAEEFSTENSC